MSRRRTYRRSRRNDTKVWLWVIGILFAYSFIISLPEWIIILTVSLIAIGAVAYVYFLYVKQVQYREGMLQLTIDEVDQMQGEEFEHYTAALFENLGYHVKMTVVTGDFGVDLVVTKDGVKTAVQCKRYTGAIGVEAIQQAHTGMAHYRCQRSLVITSSTFTRQAIILAQSSRCILVDRGMLADMLRGVDPASSKIIA